MSYYGPCEPKKDTFGNTLKCNITQGWDARKFFFHTFLVTSPRHAYMIISVKKNACYVLREMSKIPNWLYALDFFHPTSATHTFFPMLVDTTCCCSRLLVWQWQPNCRSVSRQNFKGFLYSCFGTTIRLIQCEHIFYPSSSGR